MSQMSMIVLVMCFLQNTHLYLRGLLNQDKNEHGHSVDYQILAWLVFHAAILSLYVFFSRTALRYCVALVAMAAVLLSILLVVFVDDSPAIVHAPIIIQSLQPRDVPNPRVLIFVDEDDPNACTFAEIWVNKYTTFPVTMIPATEEGDELVTDALQDTHPWTIYMRYNAEATNPELFQQAVLCNMMNVNAYDIIFFGSNVNYLRQQWGPYKDHVGFAMNHKAALRLDRGLSISELCVTGEIKCHRVGLLVIHNGYNTELIKYGFMNIASFVFVLLANLSIDMVDTIIDEKQ